MSDQRYAFIPRSTLVSERYKSLKKSSRLLYAYLIAERAGRDARFPYSYKDMRKDSGYRYEILAICIKELEQAGFLDYEHGGLELNHNNYYLEPSWLVRDS